MHKEESLPRSNGFPPARRQTPWVVRSDWYSTPSSALPGHIFSFSSLNGRHQWQTYEVAVFGFIKHTQMLIGSFPAGFSGTRVYNFVCIPSAVVYPKYICSIKMAMCDMACAQQLLSSLMKCSKVLPWLFICKRISFHRVAMIEKDK